MKEQKQRGSLICSAEPATLKEENDERRARVTRKWRRHKMLKEIRLNPAHYFTLEGFGEDETNAAHTALAGREWNEIAHMAKRAEIQKLALAKTAKHPEALVQSGWAWRHKTAFIALRSGNSLNTAAPKERVEMVFVHRGHRWEPSYTLAALARRRLQIPSATQSGNLTGDRKTGKAVQLMQRRDYAHFLLRHAKGYLREEAEAQWVMCERSLRELEQGGLGFTEAWSNTIQQDAALRELADPGMTTDNWNASIFLHHSKIPIAQMRINQAVQDIYSETGERPSTNAVRSRLNGTETKIRSSRDKNKKDRQAKHGIRIDDADMTERAFRDAVSRAVREFVFKGARLPMGRPKKIHN